MIGKKVEGVLNRAVKLAVEQKHEFLTLEHVFWSLIEEWEIAQVIRHCGGNPTEAKSLLFNYLEKEVPKIETAVHSDALSDGKDGQGKKDSSHFPVAALSIQRLIQRAILQVQSSGKSEVLPVDLLVALFQSKDSYCLALLNQFQIDRMEVIQFISHGLESVEKPASETETDEGPIPNISGSSQNADDPLKQYTVHLNEKCRDGKIDPLIGRKAELTRMIQTLCRRKKNNPLLVGEAGVGKTALAEGLAYLIEKNEVPNVVQARSVYSLDLGSLLAGAKFRGDFEQRLKRVIQALEKIAKNTGKNPILFIDEIHTLVGAGAVGGGTMDAANLLKPLLASGELSCIGSTTYAEYRAHFEKDHALARRFQKIDVLEPSTEDAIAILKGLKETFEKHHDVEYSLESIRAAVELSVKHITDRFLPDKAIDLLDEAGAKARIEQMEKLPKEGVSETLKRMIGVKDIEALVAQVARIPESNVSTPQKERLKNLERDLKLMIFGQDSAIESVVTAIQLSRSGLRSGEKPIGSFLFCGPTGVGKTELSKQIAHSLGIPFLRFDMSEYSEKHTVSRLIGAPPGYVGFDQAGLLTDAVLKSPHAVVLLDEIEKAHSDIWNILLQVMDHGTLTDNNGRKVDFRNTLLLMTSNVGSREMEKRPLGMGGGGDIEEQKPSASNSLKKAPPAALKAIENTFSPEFRNRLDGLVFFNSLAPETLAQVVSKHLMELETQLLAKGVDIEFDVEAKKQLGKKGYDRLMGARPLGRIIQEEIKKPLAQEILFGQLENGGRVAVKFNTQKDCFEFEFLPQPGSSKKGTKKKKLQTEPVHS